MAGWRNGISRKGIRCCYLTTTPHWRRHQQWMLLQTSTARAELGHMIIDPDGPLCGCGHRGHVSRFARPSVRAIEGQIAAGHAPTLGRSRTGAALVAEALRAGDALAISAFA
jgi:glucokinase